MVVVQVRVVSRRSMVSREQTSRGDSFYFIVIASRRVARETIEIDIEPGGRLPPLPSSYSPLL